MNVIEHVRTTLDNYRLFEAGETVVVGVSGGPDSLTLLHVLRRLQDDLQIQLHVGHLDHAIRPESADDAWFVAGLHEGPGADKFMEKLGTSDHEVDVMFREMIAECHGLDLTQPPPGSLPELYIGA